MISITTVLIRLIDISPIVSNDLSPRRTHPSVDTTASGQ